MHRIHTGNFGNVSTNALFGAKPGPSDVMADGYYVITHPLPGEIILLISNLVRIVIGAIMHRAYVCQ